MTFFIDETQNRGLASADEETRKRVASMGGSAPHPRGRGMQNVDPERRRQIASLGGKARHTKGA